MKQSKITSEMLAAAKAKHGEVFVIECDMNELDVIDTDEDSVVANDTKIGQAKLTEFKPQSGVFYAILKKPNNRIIGFAMTQRDPIRMGNVILENCVVKLDEKNSEEKCADDEIFGDDETNITAALQAVRLIELGQGKLKKY